MLLIILVGYLHVVNDKARRQDGAIPGYPQAGKYSPWRTGRSSRARALVRPKISWARPLGKESNYYWSMIGNGYSIAAPHVACRRASTSLERREGSFASRPEHDERVRAVGLQSPAALPDLQNSCESSRSCRGRPGSFPWHYHRR